MQNRKITRIAWIDNIRLFAIFCVVVGHSAAFLDCPLAIKEQFNLFIVAFNMPLFVVITGLNSKNSLSKIVDVKSLDTYITNLSLRIAVPCISFTLLTMSSVYAAQTRWNRAIFVATVLLIVLYLLSWMKHRNWSGMYCKILLYSFIPLCFVNQAIWFLPFILQTLLSAAFAYFVSGKLSNNSIFFYVMFILLMYVQFFSSFYSTAELALPFLLGYYLSDRYSSNKNSTKLKMLFSAVICFILAFVLFISICKTEYQFYLSSWLNLLDDGIFYIYLIRQACAILFSISFVLIFSVFYNRIVDVTKWGSLTLGIYALHGMIIFVVKEFVSPILITGLMDLIIYYLVVPILIMAVTMLLLIPLCRFKSFRLYFMGLKY